MADKGSNETAQTDHSSTVQGGHTETQSQDGGNTKESVASTIGQDRQTATAAGAAEASVTLREASSKLETLLVADSQKRAGSLAGAYSPARAGHSSAVPQGRDFDSSFRHPFVVCDCKDERLNTSGRKGYRAQACPAPKPPAPRHNDVKSYDMQGNTVFIRPGCCFPSSKTGRDLGHKTHDYGGPSGHLKKEHAITPIGTIQTRQKGTIQSTYCPFPTLQDYRNQDDSVRNKTFDWRDTCKQTPYNQKRTSLRKDKNNATLKHNNAPGTTFGAYDYRNTKVHDAARDTRDEAQPKQPREYQDTSGRFPYITPNPEAQGLKKAVKPHFMLQSEASEREDANLACPPKKDCPNFKAISDMGAKVSEFDYNSVCPVEHAGKVQVAKDRYPYRYSSSGPTWSNRTAKEKVIHACAEKVRKADKHKEYEILENDKCNHKFINQLRNVRLNLHTKCLGYQTTSLRESLEPWTEAPPFVKQPLRRATLAQHDVPRHPETAFGQYVMNELHPGWQSKERPRTLRFVIAHSCHNAVRPQWNNQWHHLTDEPLCTTDACIRKQVKKFGMEK